MEGRSLVAASSVSRAGATSSGSPMLIPTTPPLLFCTPTVAMETSSPWLGTWGILPASLRRLWGGVVGAEVLRARGSQLLVPQHYTKDKGAICTKLVKPKRKQGTKSAEEELAKGMTATPGRETS